MTPDNNEIKIRQLIENWAKAVRDKNMEAILAYHATDMVMYDVPPPFKSTGIDAYRKTWDTFYNGTELGAFNIEDMHIVAGNDVAFCYATMFCMNRNNDGIYEKLDFRLTVGLKKINKVWTILHEHHSIPATD